jgi:UDP-glucose 4-epimerase
MKKKCLILGGAGFIGSTLVGSLLNSGYDVRVFDIEGFSRKNIHEFLEDIEIIEGNFNDFSKIKIALKDVDYVYHLISTTVPSSSQLDPYFDVASNLLPSIKLLELIKECTVKKLIYLSSGGTVYGIPNTIPIKENHSTNPINSYGIVKKAIEDYLLLYNRLWDLDVCIFRLSNPYGEKQNPKGIQGVIPVFLSKAINKEIIEVWGDGNVIRDYIHIVDVMDVMVLSLSIETPEIVYNLGSGIGTSINDILQFIKENLEPDLKVSYSKGRSFDAPVNVLDISNLKNRFGLKEGVNVNDGIRKLHNYIKTKV